MSIAKTVNINLPRLQILLAKQVAKCLKIYVFRLVPIIKKSKSIILPILCGYVAYMGVQIENERWAKANTSAQSAGACGQAGAGLAWACEGGASDLYQLPLAERFCF